MDALFLSHMLSVSGSILSLSLTDDAQHDPYLISSQVTMMAATNPTNDGKLIERLLLLYRSLIRSQLDYGNFTYRLARKRYVKTLDPIYHRGLRLVLGAFRTSSTESLYAEANEVLANIRRYKLVLQY